MVTMYMPLGTQIILYLVNTNVGIRYYYATYLATEWNRLL